jgi:hypothetical protein
VAALAVAGILVLIIGLAAFAAFGPGSGDKAEEPVTNPTPEPAGVVAPPVKEPVEEPAAPTTINAAITTTPEGAAVSGGGKLLGKTPWEAELGADELPMTIQIKLDGHKTESVELTAEAPTANLTLTLEGPPPADCCGAPTDDVKPIDPVDDALNTIKDKPADPKPAEVKPKPAEVKPKPADVKPKPADVKPKPNSDFIDIGATKPKPKPADDGLMPVKVTPDAKKDPKKDAKKDPKKDAKKDDGLISPW